VLPAEFQSLFCWISLFDILYFCLFDFRNVSFNPCFVGLVFSTKRDKVIIRGVDGFNPCFVGLVFSTWLFKAQPQYYITFQSLFCWISLFDVLRRLIQKWKTGFNPCFVGLVFSTVSVNVISLPGIWFQSLFCWISLFYRNSVNNLLYYLIKFQSLFCWFSLFVLRI